MKKIRKKIRGNFLHEWCTRLLRKVDPNLTDTQVTVQEISMELESQADPEWKRKLIQWYGQYREEPKLHGVPTPSIRKLSAKYFSKVKGRTKGEIFRLCEKLLASDYVEERTIAFDWAFRLRRFHEPFDFRLLESWAEETRAWLGVVRRFVHACLRSIFVSVSWVLLKRQGMDKIRGPMDKTCICSGGKLFDPKK